MRPDHSIRLQEALFFYSYFLKKSRHPFPKNFSAACLQNRLPDRAFHATYARADFLLKFLPKFNPTRLECMKTIERFRQKISQLKMLGGDSRFIARGMAAGVFVGMTPTIPFHTVLSITMAFLCRGSKPAAVIGSWISNPLTIPIVYYACYAVGSLLTGVEGASFDEIMVLVTYLQGHATFAMKLSAIADFFHNELPVLWSIMIGGLALAAPSAALSYGITRRLIERDTSW